VIQLDSLTVRVVGTGLAFALLGLAAGWSYRDSRRIDALEVALAEMAGSEKASSARNVTTDGLPRTVSLAGSPVIGHDSAPIALVVYSDFQCPYCSSFARGTFEQLKEAYVRSGKVSLAFKHMPIDTLHSRAVALAEASACADLQDQFWPMHDVFFGDRASWSPEGLFNEAGKLQIDLRAFEDCVTTRRTSRLVTEQLREGRLAGIKGTPGFLVGRKRGPNVEVTSRIAGAQPFATFAETIDALLAHRK
jgi:protein-disulfide isomerase